MAMKSYAHASWKALQVEQMPPGTPPELVELARRIRGSVVVPGMPDYDAARAANPLYPASPQVVVFCAAPGDVVAALETAGALGLAPVARSGRHSTAGFSVNDGIVVDVSLMNHVVVDHRARTARVGAGANFGQLNAVLDTYMLHVPGGTCDDVGVAGFSQGGGYGFTSRQLGMNCDNILGVTVVLADGSIATASHEHNRELLWAICGGTGNNFGVLLEITYRLSDLYQLWGFSLQWSMDEAPGALAEMQGAFMRGSAAPAKLGYQVAFSTIDSTQTLLMMAMYDGPSEEGRATIAPLQAIGSPKLTDLGVDTYLNLNNGLLDILPGPGPVGTFEAKRSGYLATQLGEEGWSKVVEYFRTSPNPFNIIGIEPYGGAIESAPPGTNAFVHRAVDMDIFVDSFWQTGWQYNDEQQAWDWANRFMDVVAPYRSGAVYQNYPERDLADYRTAYWGDAFERLLAVKRAADPENLFAFPQSISPDPHAGAGASGAGGEQIEIVREPFSRTRRAAG